MTEVEQLKAQIAAAREALTFYAKRNHLMQGFSDFETVSGESETIECWTFDLCDERKPWGNREHYMTIENGGIARAALQALDDQQVVGEDDA